MVDIEMWRARIGLYNLRIRRSDGGRVELLLELRNRLSSRAKEKRAQGKTDNGEEETATAVVVGGEEGRGQGGGGGRRGTVTAPVAGEGESGKARVAREGKRQATVAGEEERTATVAEEGERIAALAGEGEQMATVAEEEEERKATVAGGGKMEKGGDIEESVGLSVFKWSHQRRGGGVRAGLPSLVCAVLVLLRMLSMFLFFHLILSGDVEVNPGPRLSEYECMV